jgi:hypothetical protein
MVKPEKSIFGDECNEGALISYVSYQKQLLLSKLVANADGTITWPRETIWTKAPEPLMFPVEDGPEPYYYVDILWWTPEIWSENSTLTQKRVPCPYCLKSDNVSSYGWKAKQVVSLTGFYVVVGRVYKCKNCTGRTRLDEEGEDEVEHIGPEKEPGAKYFRIWNPELMKLLPRHVQEACPFTMRKGYAFDKNLVAFLTSCVSTGQLSFEAFYRVIREMHTTRHVEMEHRYYSALKSFFLSKEKPRDQLKYFQPLTI